MVIARKIISKVDGKMPKPEDIEFLEEILDPIMNGEILSEAIYFSIDHYMGAYAPNVSMAPKFIGRQVAKVIESKNAEFPVGTYIVGTFGWRTHTVSRAPFHAESIWKIPDPEGLPLSYSLGILGAPGNTAYFGFLEICQPKAGETVVVTGAAGVVGHIVGQIAKILGCVVIGIASSKEKGKWLLEELKFDHFINRQDPQFATKLNQVTPNGVDCFFDTVGGEISGMILTRMNTFGRVSMCGAVPQPNYSMEPKVNAMQWLIITKQLKIEGFLLSRWENRWFEGIAQNKKWILEGKLKYRETITEGTDTLLQILSDVHAGRNIGKTLIRV